MTARRLVVTAMPGSLVAATVALVALHLAHGGRALPAGWYVVFVCGLAFAVVGGLVVWRRPRHRLGWVLVWLGGVGCIQTAVELYAAYSIHVHALPAVQWVYLLSVFAGGSLVSLLTLVFLLFPDGLLPTGRWRWLTWVTIVVGAARALAEALAPGHFSDTVVTNPIGLPVTWVHTVDDMLNIGTLPLLLAAAAGVLLRWRRSAGIAREQYKCLAAAAATWPIVMVPLLVMPSRISNSAVGEALFGVAVVAIAIGIGVAVLRYRLYDIDRVISRTVSYGLITGLLVGVYIASIALTTRVLPLSSSFGVAASTLAAVVLFQPVRRRVQDTVDRRFNRARYDAERTVDAFSARLRDSVQVEAVQRDLVHVVGGALQPATVSVWMRTAGA